MCVCVCVCACVHARVHPNHSSCHFSYLPVPTSLVSGVKRRHSDQDDGSDYSDYEVPGGQQAPALQPAATTPCCMCVANGICIIELN